MNHLDTLRRVLHHEANAVADLAGRLDASYAEAVDEILACRGRVITCGLGKSGHIARKTAGTFASTGTPSLFMHAAEALHGDAGMATADDIVLMYSFSGESDDLVRLIPALQAIGARTMLMTGRANSSVGRMADRVLLVPVTEEACPNNLAPTTSTTVMLALSDALAVAVMESRGFGPEDFARFHPSGALGKRLLLRVRDVMRQGADLATVQPDSTILDTMRAITNAGAGAACVVDGSGALLGFVSDGDVRRHVVASRPLDMPAEAIMVREPTSVGPDLMAIEALEVFQNLPKKVGELPVVEEGTLVGLLMLKDLLRSGIL